MSLCLCHCVATMSLCRVVHTGDIKHQYEFFLICVTLPLCRYVASVNQALISLALAFQIVVQVLIVFFVIVYLNKQYALHVSGLLLCN